jgi:hypothetical protein
MTLQELAPYLPFNLKCEYIGNDGRSEVYSDPLKDDYNHIFQLVGIVGYTYYGKCKIQNDIDAYEENSFKPIFHPLSDLTKPCLEGGKIPIVELAIMSTKSENFYDYIDMGQDRSAFFVTTIIANGEFTFSYCSYMDSFYKEDEDTTIIASKQLQLFQWLYQHHFWLGDQSRFGQDIVDVNSL